MTKKKLTPAEQRIREALDASPIDIDIIYKEANTRGLPLSLRAECWLVLLEIDTDNLTEIETDFHHEEEDIVVKDVDRSMWSWGTCEHEYQERTKYREQLSSIINSVLGRNRQLHYYQGYHDIGTVLLMCTENVGHSHNMLERLSLGYFRESMNETLDIVIKELDLLLIIIKLEDPELADHICSGIPNFKPFAIISWVLTWFSHSLDEPELLLRLFDFFLTSHPLMVIYFSSILVLNQRESILSKPSELSSIHNVINQLTKTITHDTIEGLIVDAKRVFSKQTPFILLSQPENTLPEDNTLIQYPYDYISEQQRKCLQTNMQIPQKEREKNFEPFIAVGLVAAIAVVGYWWAK